MVRFDAVVGTGGIGTGKIYRLEGNESLGRNETRFGRLMDQRDFCKLHIVFHYIALLLRAAAPQVSVLPVGAVGDDPEGLELLRLMQSAGMDMNFVETVQGVPTLFALCYQFPDGSGGNITERNSASSMVTPADIEKSGTELEGKRVLAAALPEVPLEARAFLLSLGRRLGAVNAASFVSGEMEWVRKTDLLSDIDILTLNLDEAKALIPNSVSATEEPVVETVRHCFRYAAERNGGMKCIITAGEQGFYAFLEGKEAHLPPLNVHLENSAGAGDALLAGVLVGEALGLPFFDSTGPSTLNLANCVAAQSVEAQDTINLKISVESFRNFCRVHGHPEIADLFQNRES